MEEQLNAALPFLLHKTAATSCHIEKSDGSDGVKAECHDHFYPCMRTLNKQGQQAYI